MKKLFVIAPYKVDKLFEQKRIALSEICLNLKMELILAEDKKLSKSLNAEETIKLFENVDFYLADLSLERPSCYYELGYLQSKNKSVIIIAQSGTHIHQLLNRENISFYENLTEYKEIVLKLIRQQNCE